MKVKTLKLFSIRMVRFQQYQYVQLTIFLMYTKLSSLCTLICYTEKLYGDFEDLETGQHFKDGETKPHGSDDESGNSTDDNIRTLRFTITPIHGLV